MSRELKPRTLATNSLATPVVAGLELMRIIPDNAPGYPDTLVTVKRYLLDGATSALCPMGFSVEFSLLAPSAGFSLCQIPTGKASTE
jgi:hypothetical protein